MGLFAQGVFRSHPAPAPLKQERDADHDAQQDIFRSYPAPALLKFVHVGDGAIGDQVFRSQPSPAPLKRVGYGQPFCYMSVFRSQPAPAPLKDAVGSVVLHTLESFPELTGSGPIEGRCLCIHPALSCVFRS